MSNNFSDVERVLGQSPTTRHDVNPLASKTLKFRPTKRPPMAILQIFDDGRESCETVRVREDSTTIGRSKKCDICIPHDAKIEKQHLVVKRLQIRGKFSWVIQNTSANNSGLFVRVRRARLRHESEFLVGSHRIRFDEPDPASTEDRSTLSTRLARGSIPGQSSESESVSCASLSLVTKPNITKIWLLGPEYWIGRSPECALCISDDNFLAPVHAKVTRQPNGEWHAQTEKVPNGLWIRVSMIKVKSSCTFQVGEQKLRLTIC